jgi:hypothetical protein
MSSCIAGDLLFPGEPAPSGAALSRVTGYSTLTCRKALSTLIKDGVLVPGASPAARPRVPPRAPSPGTQTPAGAARALSESLAARRRATGLTQPQLAGLTGFSVTTIAHAETGRLWQSRRFWEQADKELSAGGELLVLYDACRVAALAADPATDDTEGKTVADIPLAAVTVSGPVACVTITWANGEATTVYPPATPARPVGTTPAN